MPSLRWSLFPLSVALAVVSGAVDAKPARFAFDPVHTQVLFFVSHLGFSQQLGRFPIVSGDFTFDPDDWSSASVDATIDVGALYLGNTDWEKKVLSDFFAVKTHPTMHFAGERLERIEAGKDGKGDRGRLTGQLTLHGVTRPVTLDVTLNRIGRHSYSLKYVAGFSATTTIRRSDFGITKLLPAVGDEVQVRLEIEGLREKDTEN